MTNLCIYLCTKATIWVLILGTYTARKHAAFARTLMGVLNIQCTNLNKLLRRKHENKATVSLKIDLNTIIKSTAVLILCKPGYKWSKCIFMTPTRHMTQMYIYADAQSRSDLIHEHGQSWHKEQRVGTQSIAISIELCACNTWKMLGKNI